MMANVQFVVLAFLFLQSEAAMKRGRKYNAVIMQRPDEIESAKCGDEVKMVCLAEGDPVPDVEWWYHDINKKTKSKAQKLTDITRNGRVKIKVEKFYVVRSTIVLEDAKPTDAGIYQCRASNSAKRHKPGTNVYQHWKIEEAPLMNVNCQNEHEEISEVTVQTTVTNMTSYNNTEFDDVIKTTTEAALRMIKEDDDVSSGMFTTTTTTKIVNEAQEQKITMRMETTTASGSYSTRSNLLLYLYIVIHIWRHMF